MSTHTFRKSDGTPTERASIVIRNTGPILLGAGISLAVSYANGVGDVGYPTSHVDLARFVTTLAHIPTSHHEH